MGPPSFAVNPAVHRLDRRPAEDLGADGSVAAAPRTGDKPSVRRCRDQDERPSLVKRLEPPTNPTAVQGCDREAGRALLNLAGRAGRHEDRATVIGQLVIVGVTHVDAGHVGPGEGAEPFSALAQIGGVGVHEDDRLLIERLGFVQFTLYPAELILAQAEVRSAGPRGHDIQEEASVSSDCLGIRQLSGTQDSVKGIEVSGFEVMVAGQDVKRQPQWRHCTTDERKLVRRAVIRIVAGEQGEIEGAVRQLIRHRDDALQVGQVLTCIVRNMQVADV